MYQRAKGTLKKISIYILLSFQSDIKYVPGDHVGILAVNRKEIVDTVLARLKGVDDLDSIVQLQVMKETLTPTGKINIFIDYIIQTFFIGCNIIAHAVVLIIN